MLNIAPPNSEASIKEGYEVTDMNARIVVTSLSGLLILMFGACVVIIMVIRGFNQSRSPLDTTPASSLATAGVQIPAEPHLQMYPVEDRIKIDEENQTEVDSYGVLSEEPGMERVHIPVNRAMALLAEGKVPYRQAPQVAVEGAAAVPFVEADPFADPAPAEAAPAEAAAQ